MEMECTWTEASLPSRLRTPSVPYPIRLWEVPDTGKRTRGSSARQSALSRGLSAGYLPMSPLISAAVPSSLASSTTSSWNDDGNPHNANSRYWRGK